MANINVPDGLLQEAQGALQTPGLREAASHIISGIAQRKAYARHYAEHTDKAIGILRRFEVAKNKREQFLPIWQEVANLVLPAHGGFYNLDEQYSIYTYDTHPDKYDDTATNALVKAASAFYSYTANPATNWFSFSLISNSSSKKKKNQMQDPYSVYRLLKTREVREYLDEAAQTTARYINSKAQAGWHAVAQEVLAYSTSALFVIEDTTDQILNIQPVSLKDLYLLNNVAGDVGEVYRTLVMTNEQVVQEFGVKGCVPEEVMQGAINDPMKERTILHAVYPRVVRDVTALDPANMPYASIWVDMQSKHILYESGFEEMPYAVARINVPAGYIYGFSPAMNVRHTVKSLNKLVKQKLTAGDLALSPSMNVPLDTYVNPLSMKPAALNYHEPDAAYRAEPMHTIGNFQINTETIKDARDQVRQGMLIDLIEQNNKDNTYQAMQEQLLQLKLMSPWQGGIEKSCLRPLVLRVFAILTRRGGILPDMPPVLEQAIKQGKVKIKIVYESPLAKAQQHFKLSAIERVLAFAGQTAQMGGMEAVNMDEMIRLYAELLGAPQGILYSPEEMEQKRQQQQQQQDQMQQAMMAQQQAQTAQAGAGALLNAQQAQGQQIQNSQMMGGIQ